MRTFQDSDGDGIGDLRGLIRRLDYLAGLSVTCLWLLPFYPSPWRDDGYDVTDHYAVHPDLGDLGDFVDLVHAAGDRGMRIVVDLVLNHTSNEHPWFRLAREGDPRFVDYYVWADEKPPDAEKGVVFPGVQRSTWSYDRKARRSLLLSMPGTPVVYYGDEIGMGEDLSVPERGPVRTPMQWSDERNGGFSPSRREQLSVPVVSSGPFGYRSVNVADQQRDPSSLLNWFERAVVARTEAPGFGSGAWEELETGARSVLALRFRHLDRCTVTVHNLGGRRRRVGIEDAAGAWDVFGNRRYEPPGSDGAVDIDGYGYRWLRLRPS